MSTRPPARVQNESIRPALDQFRNQLRNLKTLQEVDTSTLVGLGDRVAQWLKQQDVAMSQLRPLLQEVYAIRLAWRNDADGGEEARRRMHLLKPLLAYRIGRIRGNQNQDGWNSFYDLVKDMLDRVKDSGDFERVYAFIQTLVAYHRFYGGKD